MAEKKAKKGKGKGSTPQQILDSALNGDDVTAQATATATAGDMQPSGPVGDPPKDKAPPPAEQSHGYETVIFTASQTQEGGAEDGAVGDKAAAQGLQDQQKSDAKSTQLGTSGVYEIPDHSRVASGQVPAPQTGYMALQGVANPISEYHTPEVSAGGGQCPAPQARHGAGVVNPNPEYQTPEGSKERGRGNRALGGLARQLASSFMEMGENPSPSGSNESAPPSSLCRRIKWTLVLALVSLLVAILAIVISSVAIGKTKCGNCDRLEMDLALLETQIGNLAMGNCSYGLVASCSFTSLEKSCETTPTPLTGTGNVVLRSLGCVVSDVPANSVEEGEGEFYTSTLLNRPGGYVCQCYGNTTTMSDSNVKCNMEATRCFV